MMLLGIPAIVQPEPTKLCSKAFLSHKSVWISLAESLHWVLGFLLRSIDFKFELRKASLSRSKLRKTSVLFGKTLRARGYVDKRVDQSGFHKSMCFTGRDLMSVNISISSVTQFDQPRWPAREECSNMPMRAKAVGGLCCICFKEFCSSILRSNEFRIGIPFKFRCLHCAASSCALERTQAKRYKEASSSSESRLAHTLGYGAVAFLAHATTIHRANDTCTASIFLFRPFSRVFGGLRNEKRRTQSEREGCLSWTHVG